MYEVSKKLEGQPLFFYSITTQKNNQKAQKDDKNPWQ